MSEKHKSSRIVLDHAMESKLRSVVVGNGVARKLFHASYDTLMYHVACCSIKFVCQKVQAYPFHMGKDSLGAFFAEDGISSSQSPRRDLVSTTAGRSVMERFAAWYRDFSWAMP